MKAETPVEGLGSFSITVMKKGGRIKMHISTISDP